MKTRRTIHRLESLMDALDRSKKVVSDTRIGTEVVLDRMTAYQSEYHALTGHYYSIKEERNGGRNGRKRI